MSVFFPTKDFMSITDCNTKKRRICSNGVLFSKRSSISRSRNTQTQNKPFIETEAPNKLKRALLERLVSTIVEPDEDKEQKINKLEKLVDIYLESEEHDTIIIIPKDRKAIKQKEASPITDLPLKIREVKADDAYNLFKSLSASKSANKNKLKSGKGVREIGFFKRVTYKRVSLGLLDKAEATGLICMRTYKSNKPPTRIEILHTDYKHLRDHPINKAIFHMNSLISILRNKELTNTQKQISMILIKTLNISLPKGELNTQLFKSKDYLLKEKILRHFFSILNTENNYITDYLTNTPKVYINTRNNGILIKTLFKNRQWSITSKIEEASFYWTDFCNKAIIKSLPIQSKGIVKMYNHMEYHYCLTDKKALLKNMSEYYSVIQCDPFDVLPLTFHVQLGVSDPEFKKFEVYYELLEKQSGVKKLKNVWIVKLGENSNRGYGIQISRDITEITRMIEKVGKHSYIIQKYIENPLLVNKRKFDIRMYGLITSINGLMKGYFYEDGYIRTSSREYTIKKLANKVIHLTNDAVQQKNEDYGKYEPGNKLSFNDFQKFLDANHPSLCIDFYRDVLPSMKVTKFVKE